MRDSMQLRIHIMGKIPRLVSTNIKQDHIILMIK